MLETFLWKSTMLKLLTGVLTAVLTLLGLGCSKSTVDWSMDRGHMSTQFEIGLVSTNKVVIGFPGELNGTAAGAGSYEKPVATDPE